MESPITIYYDYEPAIGINATSQAFISRNDYFKSWDDFHHYIDFELNKDVVLIPITPRNYQFLCTLGLFNESI